MRFLADQQNLAPLILLLGSVQPFRSVMKGAVFPAAPSGERSLGAVLRTKGVGSVMVGLVVLALLLGARRWTDLDAVSGCIRFVL
jgi:hypothetical protein